jgi:MscS family membrane protein
LNFMIGFAVILQSWGYNVTGFVASLGIGGLAFALAAKDTAANLFGSLVIFGDKPFEIGDWIKTDEVEGTVEDIGIRSTKVRTFAQALVHVPNATLANSAIINWSRMGKRRIKMNVGLTYETTEAQMRTIVEQIRSMLQGHEEIDQSTLFIHFTDYSESSLDIFCYFFTKTTVWGEYLRVREDVNLKIKKIVEENGSAFAFPSRTVYLESDERP